MAVLVSSVGPVIVVAVSGSMPVTIVVVGVFVVSLGLVMGKLAVGDEELGRGSAGAVSGAPLSAVVSRYPATTTRLLTARLAVPTTS